MTATAVATARTCFEPLNEPHMATLELSVGFPSCLIQGGRKLTLSLRFAILSDFCCIKFSFFTPNKGLMAGWTVEEVGGWLESEDMVGPAAAFQAQGVRGADLMAFASAEEMKQDLATTM